MPIIQKQVVVSVTNRLLEFHHIGFSYKKVTIISANEKWKMLFSFSAIAGDDSNKTGTWMISQTNPHEKGLTTHTHPKKKETNMSTDLKI